MYLIYTYMQVHCRRWCWFCMYIYIYVCVCIYIYTYIYVYIHTYINAGTLPALVLILIILSSLHRLWERLCACVAKTETETETEKDWKRVCERDRGMEVCWWWWGGKLGRMLESKNSLGERLKPKRNIVNGFRSWYKQFVEPLRFRDRPG